MPPRPVRHATGAPPLPTETTRDPAPAPALHAPGIPGSHSPPGPKSEIHIANCAPIVRATPADLAYVVALQKRNHEALGFIPRAALAEKVDLGRIWLATENGEPAGYLHHGSLARPEVRIFQAAVQYDARRRHVGLSLVADLLARARSAGAGGVSLRCLDFLDANDFWTAAGFTLLGTEPGARGTLNVWGCLLGAGGRDKESRRGGDKVTNAGVAAAPHPAVRLFPCHPVPLSPGRIVPSSPFSFHSRVHPCPRCGAPTTDTWTRGAVRRRVCARCVSAA